MRVNSIVTHPLFLGPGIVMAIHADHAGQPVYEVFWPAWERVEFHSGSSLRVVQDVGA